MPQKFLRPKEKFTLILFGQDIWGNLKLSIVSIDALWDKNSKAGFKIATNPERDEIDPNFIIGQTVAVSRATDAQEKYLMEILCP